MKIKHDLELLKNIANEGRKVFGELDKEFKLTRNASTFRNGWFFSHFLGNPELDELLYIEEIGNLHTISLMSHDIGFGTDYVVNEYTDEEFVELLDGVKQKEFTLEDFEEFNKSFPIKEKFLKEEKEEKGMEM